MGTTIIINHNDEDENEEYYEENDYYTARDRKSSVKNTGKQLEDDFTAFMKKELGFDDAIPRQPVRGESVSAGQVDIHGIKKDTLSEFLFKVGIFLFGLSILTILTEWSEMESLLNDIAFNLTSIGSGLLVFGVGGLVLGIIGKKQRTVHAWVECKDLARKVHNGEMLQLYGRIQALGSKGDWVANEIYFVSTNGFSPEALRTANEKGIICFIRKGKKSFEEVE